MHDEYSNEPLLDIYVFETEQLLEQLEQLMLICEENNGFTKEAIDEIFRIMHTIKGSSAMMMFNGISSLAHCMEDLFYCLRNGKDANADNSYFSDLVFEGIDFIIEEISKIKSGNPAEGDPESIIDAISKYIKELQGESFTASGQKDGTDTGKSDQVPYQPEMSGNTSKYAYKAILRFEEGCEMENIRAYAVVHNLKDMTSELYHIPEDLNTDESCEEIKQNGFQLFFASDLGYGKIQEILLQTIFLKELILNEIDVEDIDRADRTGKADQDYQEEKPDTDEIQKVKKETQLSSSHQNI